MSRLSSLLDVTVGGTGMHCCCLYQGRTLTWLWACAGEQGTGMQDEATGCVLLHGYAWPGDQAEGDTANDAHDRGV